MWKWNEIWSLRISLVCNCLAEYLRILCTDFIAPLFSYVYIRISMYIQCVHIFNDNAMCV